MNAKEEFLSEIKSNNSKVRCAIIEYNPYHNENKTGKGANGTRLLTTGWDDNDFEEFLNSIDFKYDDGYGTQELFGTIWYEDGTWSDRDEYDGAENWRYNKSPEIPKELIRKDKERDNKLKELGI